MTAPRTIAVLRALDLGDMLCAVPAFRALRLGYPEARITLVGLPWAEAFAARYRHLLDDFVEFPGHPRLPERPVDPRAAETFLSQMRARRFDLAVQLHGSGEVTNGIVAQWGACAIAGLSHEPLPPGAFATWRGHLNEVEQLLRVADALGLPRQGLGLEFPSRAEDLSELEQVRVTHPQLAHPYAVVHPGAKWPSRRWAPARFAEVAHGLGSAGLPVVLTGVASEASLTREVARLSCVPTVDLAGRTTLGGFAAVLRRAAVVVTNDTGASHLAVAVDTPSVVVSSGSDVIRWAPLDQYRHPTFAGDAPCRPCTFESCPYSHECAPSSPAEVLQTALRLAGRTGLRHPIVTNRA